MLLNVIARPGDAFAGDAAPAHRQPRGPRRPSAGTSAGPSRSTARCWPAAWSSGSTSRTTDGPHGPAHRRPAARLRAQPAAVAVRARRPRPARPRSRRPTPSTCVSVIESTLDDPRQVLSAQQFKARGEAVAADEGRGHRVRGADGAARRVTYPKPLAELLEAAYEIYRRGHPWVADYELSPEVGGPRHVRAGDDLRRVRRVLRAGPVRGPGAALPRRRLQGAAADRARRGQDRGARPTSSSGSASSSARSTPACSTSGSSCATRRTTARAGRPATTRPAAGHRQRAGVPGAGAQRAVPPGRAGRARRTTTSSASSTRTRGWDADAWADALERLLRRARRDRHRRRRARARAADHRRAAGPAGRSGRSSTTRPATTTGASPPRSTSPRPTRPARPCCGSPTSGSCPGF